MKFSEQWLREWIDPALPLADILQQLVMAGLEVEATAPSVADDDTLIELKITPNRGDCLSVRGVAREVAAMTHTAVKPRSLATVPVQATRQLPVTVAVPAACPRYLGRVIQHIDPQAKTPVWLQHRLAQAGLASIHPVVDVANYVMVELGQPLHAFDLAKLQGGITVRYACPNESLTLLNGQSVTLSSDTLVIADAQRAQAIAGIMGGEGSAVTAATTSLFLESAFFMPNVIAGRARRYGLKTDASHRFERGVDPALAEEAIACATALLLAIVGGEAGPLVVQEAPLHLPQQAEILLRRTRIARILGIAIADVTVIDILNRLGMQVRENAAGWQVKAPSYRFDINIEADLIEEIARLYGYNHIPESVPLQPVTFRVASPAQSVAEQARQILVARGYHETITYSFIAPQLQQQFAPEITPVALLNPISTDLSVLRTSLWPSLLNVASYNLNRQQNRIRLFEIGTCFLPGPTVIERPTLSGLILGPIAPEQWGALKREVDFFDLKGDVQILLETLGIGQQVSFVPAQHTALHPGQSCQVVYAGNRIGYMGQLHPRLQNTLGLESKVYLFELDLAVFAEVKQPLKFVPISKFPSIRRDIALLIAQTVSVAELNQVITAVGGGLLQTVQLFDVYQGKPVPVGQKSIALGLIFQHDERTLVETEVSACVDNIIVALKERFNVTMRD